MKNDFHHARFGDFQVIGAWYGSRENSAIGSLQTILGGMDSIALLVVDFSAEEQDTHGAPLETPSNEELQKILDNLNYR